MYMKAPLVDWCVDPIAHPFRWGIDKFVDVEIEHDTLGDIEVTNLTILVGKRLLYVSLRGKWFSQRKFKPLFL